MSDNTRGWTWIDDNAERSEEEIDALEPTLNALAAEWSDIHNEIEREGFLAQARYEDEGGGPEDPECPHCNRGFIGFDTRISRFYCYCCHHWEPQRLTFLKCPSCNGEGVDRQAIAERDKAERQRHANREVRQDIIEGMLERHGARMCRPYEHWNEDERLMEYMECGRFGE